MGIKNVRSAIDVHNIIIIVDVHKEQHGEYQ